MSLFFGVLRALCARPLFSDSEFLPQRRQDAKFWGTRITRNPFTTFPTLAALARIARGHSSPNRIFSRKAAKAQSLRTLDKDKSIYHFSEPSVFAPLCGRYSSPNRYSLRVLGELCARQLVSESEFLAPGTQSSQRPRGSKQTH
jgi:hypothetical protein